MREKLCLIVPESLRAETESVLEELEVEKKLGETAPVLRTFFGNCPDRETLFELMKEKKGPEKTPVKYLLLCSGKKPQVPKNYEERIRVHCLEHLAEAFLGPSAFKKKQGKRTCLLLPGMLDSLLEDRIRNLETADIKEVLSAPAVLLLDTGLYPEVEKKSEVFSTNFEISCEVADIGPDFYRLFLKNLILCLKHEKLEKSEKKAAEKSAFYAMAFEMLRELIHAENEKKAIEGITEVFKMLFAPEEFVYFSVKDGIVWEPGEIYEYGGKEVPETGTEREKKVKMELESENLKTFEYNFLESETNYFIEETGDGFALKLQNNGETLGIIKLQKILYPQYIKEYLSLAHDIATVCGLVISNSRRYSEIKSSRKILAEYADVLKVINRILRHDINNQLNMINMAVELYRESPDEKYLPMALKAVDRGAGIIRQMGELENLVSKGSELNPYNIKEVAEELVRNYPVRARIEGSCKALADEAFPSVLDNIIRNAITHGKSEQIDFLIKGEENHCVIRIADYGTGIPDEVKSKVFEEGFRYGNTGNTGLGLYIVKKVIDRYGGSISVEDNRPQGTVFVIKLKSALQNEA